MSLKNFYYWRNPSALMKLSTCHRCGKRAGNSSHAATTHQTRPLHNTPVQPTGARITTSYYGGLNRTVARRSMSSEAHNNNNLDEIDKVVVNAINPNELLDKVMLRPSQEAFHRAITAFANRPGKFKRGSVDFIYTALQVCVGKVLKYI